MTVINTNVSSLNAQAALASNARGLSKAMQQLSTGKRISSAADDAAGLAIATRLTSQIRGLNQAVRNANDGISMIQIAEGASVEMTNMLQRMRELAVQSANDTNTNGDRSFLNQEYSALKSEINRIGATVEWNGSKIMDGTFGSMDFQVGANANQTISLNIGNFRSSTSNLSASSELAPKVDVATDTTVPEFDLTSLDSEYDRLKNDDGGEGLSTSDLVGVAFSVKVAGVSVEYKVTQSDIDSVDSADTDLSEIVAANVVSQLDKTLNAKFSFGTDVFSVTDGEDGTFTVEINSSHDLLSSVIRDGGESLVVTDEDADLPEFDFAGLDTKFDTLDDDVTASTSDLVGTKLSIKVAGQVVDYTITQDDIDSVDPDTTDLRTIVASKMALATQDALDETYGEDVFTVTDNEDGAFTVELSNDSDTSNVLQASASEAYTYGDLEVIDSSSIETQSAANASIEAVDEALDLVNSKRATMGATINRLQYSVDNLTNVSTRSAEARSRIEDTNYADSTMDLAKRQIIQQAATAMLAQANQQPQQVLTLLK